MTLLISALIGAIITGGIAYYLMAPRWVNPEDPKTAKNKDIVDSTNGWLGRGWNKYVYLATFTGLGAAIGGGIGYMMGQPLPFRTRAKYPQWAQKRLAKLDAKIAEAQESEQYRQVQKGLSNLQRYQQYLN